MVLMHTSKNVFSVGYETVTLYGPAFQQSSPEKIGSKDGRTTSTLNHFKAFSLRCSPSARRY
jgi:hypothetical protein